MNRRPCPGSAAAFVVVAAACLAAPASVAGQSAAPAPARRVLVMPFENVNREGKIFWLSEASAVLLTEDLDARGGQAISRDERLRAFDRLQLPASAVLSEATVIRVGELVGASDIVMGSLALDGTGLTVRARDVTLDVGRVTTETAEHGPLDELFATFDRIAERLVPGTRPAAEHTPKDHAPLPAFEDYIKGLLAETPKGQLKFLETALKLYPGYDAARLALWQVHSAEGDHARALAAALEVPPPSGVYRRARFLAALSEIRLKQYDEAFATLNALLEATPSPVIDNNLGVVQLRRGASTQTARATYYFNKACEADREDADYTFNLGYAYWLDRDPQAAIYWLRETVRRNPGDGDAHFVLGTALLGTGAEAEGTREKELARQLSSTYAQWERRPAAATEPVPRGLERLREDLERPRVNRLDTTLATSEQRDQREMAAFHLERGRRFFEQDNDRDATAELRRSLYLSPYQVEPHLLLGRIYLRTGRVKEAIDELKISLWSEETSAAHVVLGDAYLQAGNPSGARSEAERALAMDPQSADAKKLLAKITK
jgi:Tfp pilus assembly protein PilF